MSSLYVILLYNLFVTIWCKDNKLIFYLSLSRCLNNIGGAHLVSHSLVAIHHTKQDKCIFLAFSRPRKISYRHHALAASMVGACSNICLRMVSSEQKMYKSYDWVYFRQLNDYALTQYQLLTNISNLFWISQFFPDSLIIFYLMPYLKRVLKT